MCSFFFSFFNHNQTIYCTQISSNIINSRLAHLDNLTDHHKNTFVQTDGQIRKTKAFLVKVIKKIIEVKNNFGINKDGHSSLHSQSCEQSNGFYGVCTLCNVSLIATNKDCNCHKQNQNRLVQCSLITLKQDESLNLESNICFESSSCNTIKVILIHHIQENL